MEAVIQNLDCIVDCLEEKEISREEATGEDIINSQSLLSSINWLLVFIKFVVVAFCACSSNCCSGAITNQSYRLIAHNCILTTTALQNLKDVRKENTYNALVVM